MAEFKVTTHGFKEVERMMAIAPSKFSSALTRWLNTERNKFVGKPGKSGRAGVWTRQMMRQKLEGRSGKWSKAAAKAFKGFVKKMPTAWNMTAGVNLSGHSGTFIESLAQMQSTHYHSARTAMAIPNYENLAYYGITSYSAGRKTGTFKKLLQENRMTAIRLASGRSMYIMTDQEQDEDDPMRPVFTIKRGTRITRQYPRFDRAFKRNVPAMIERGDKAISRATERLLK